MTLHLKIQKFIPFFKRAFESQQQQKNKQFIIALEVDASQRIRYLISEGQLVSNERLSFKNIQKDVYCTSGLKQCIQVVLYKREKRSIDKQPIHMEKQEMVRSATIPSETLLKLYKQNQCKNMKQCIINVQMNTRQRQHYLIKREIPTDKLDCKVDITFKYDKFRICQGNMPLSKVIHRINLSWKQQQNKQKIRYKYTTEYHEQTLNSTKQSIPSLLNKNNNKLSQKILVPNKIQDEPQRQNEEQFSKQTKFYHGRCATTNIFSCCDNFFSGIEDSQIKFQIIQDVYR